MSFLIRSALSMLSPAGPRARLMVFPYHRIVEAPDPLTPGSSTAERFENHLRWLSQYCHPLPLSEAVRRLESGSLPSRAVALTFDDGYENNLSVAAPLLKKHGVPATLFLAIDALERGIMWNDIIIEAVRKADGTLDARDCGLGSLDVTDENRLDVSKQLIAKVQYLPIADRMAAAEALYATASSVPPARQMLKPEQIPELAEYGIEVGAHTVNHPILKTLNDAEARREIADSRDWIESIIGTRPTLFAYPNGKRDFDYDGREMEIVESLGFDAAVAANWGCAAPGTSLYELPRFKPWEKDERGFATRLCKTVARTYA
ncbi:MAG: polysaccharide deacetylase family protein [Pseudomonadota bacterium]